jgi:hypothetical protein
MARDKADSITAPNRAALQRDRRSTTRYGVLGMPSFDHPRCKLALGAELIRDTSGMI